MNTLLRGSIAGVAGAGLMTAVIGAGQTVQIFRRPAPAEVTENIEKKAGLRRRLPEPAFQASWLAAHLGFGAASGAGYALLRRVIPGPPILLGLAYGGAIWAANYLGALPALGLYPLPRSDSRARTLTMIAAHAVYGVTTAEIEQWLS